MEEKADDLLEVAATLAEERGYRHLPEEELMRLAAEFAGQRYATMSVAQKVGRALLDMPPADRGGALMDHREAASASSDQQFLDYMAAVLALSPEARGRHRKAMVEKFGPGFLVGT